jgi:hypothetical protein
MNVDFGLICLFTIQVGLVFLVYHAWKGIKAEISALEVHRRGNEAIASSIAAIRAEVDEIAKRMGEVEAAPKAGKARMEEITESLGKVDRRVDSVESKLGSMQARIAADARWKSKVKEEEETAPASQDEGYTIPTGQMPPGAIPLSVQPQSGAVPPGFGVVGRKARHG